MHRDQHTTLWWKIGGGIAIILMAFIAGIYLGFDSGSHRAGAAETVDLGPFWEVWDLIDERFVAASSTLKVPSEKDRVYGAIAGLVDSLGDPYTTFLPPEELKSFEEDIRGNFEGVGMEVDIRDQILTVVSPLKDTPAFIAGIKAGDKILQIDETSTLGLSVESAIKIIRGPAGTVVKLLIKRDGIEKPFEISLTRAVIKIPSAESKLRQDGVFVITLYNFSANATTEFKKALRAFAESKSHKLIIDLRNNPGGFLEAAVDISSWFLPSGKVIVQEDFGGKAETEVFRSKGYDVFAGSKIKMVILVNKGSASASEIVAGALSEHGIATVIGTQTFGKGSVQELIPITGDASVKVTIARWLTPKGNTISEKGITPDIVVDISDEDLKAGRDPQMEKAAEVLKSMK